MKQAIRLFLLAMILLIAPVAKGATAGFANRGGSSRLDEQVGADLQLLKYVSVSSKLKTQDSELRTDNPRLQANTGLSSPGSSQMEQLPSSEDVDIGPRLPAKCTLLDWSSQHIVRENTPANYSGLFQMNEESRVESEGKPPSYWRILGPVLITVGVGTATWLLFTIRSG
ncbi:MAG TPA: hypothetical protein ENH10_02760 [Bacteroidetes bacterium]|nr:hypothetical protein [Bacteroidota bacterium]HEX04062.1 hypothetical protein [Bacteroidota bacterium]